MTKEEMCYRAHPWLLAGVCPWCEQALGRGCAVEARIASPGLRVWDAPALLEALDSPHFDVRYAVIRSIGHVQTQALPLLPVLNKAMCDSCYHVRINVPSALLFLGEQLSSEKADDLERGLQVVPGDLAARGLLLGHYYLRQYLFEGERDPSNRHKLWLIEHAPRSEITGDLLCALHGRCDPDEYAQGKLLWLRHAEENEKDLTILAHAGSYLTIDDPVDAERLYRKCQHLEPDNPEWPRQFAHLCALTMKHDRDPETRRGAAVRALAELSRVWQLTEEDQRFGLHEKIAEAALYAEDHAKVRQHAEAMLKTETADEYQRKNRNPRYRAKLFLGRVALAEGDLQTAERCLIEAGELASHTKEISPGMLLARDLLAQDSRAVPLAYLRWCATFWHMPDQRIDQWIYTVEQGGIPDFGPNLA